MKVYTSEKVRNICLLGHAGSGKTTLTETMLFESGTIKRRGGIQENNSVSDSNPIEKEKQKSVFTSLTHLDWRGTKINFFDTPGTPDFIGEVISAMHVSDCGLFVLNSEYGVEVGTESLWRRAEETGLPSIFVVNKLDSEQSDFQNTVNMVKERFGRGIAILQFPYSEGNEFHAIIDVLKMTMYEFPEDGGRPEKLPIPESLKSQAELLHNELVESIAENDESLMDLYFENGELDEYQMRDGLRQAVLNRDIFPLFCSSAERNMGTGRMMGFLSNVLPSPLNSNPMLTEDGDDHEISSDDKISFFVFKSYNEAHVGELSYFKVTGGTLNVGEDLENKRTSNISRVGSLYISQGNKRVDVSQIEAGDIGVTVKLKDAEAGDTLAEKSKKLKLASPQYPASNIRAAISLRKEGEEDKLANALHQLEKEDRGLLVEHSKELNQVILHGQGEEHLAVLLHQLTNRFHLDVEFKTPRIPYRETITKAQRSHYKHKKQSGGAGQFAEVYMLIEPWHKGMDTPDDLNVRDVQEFDLEWGGKFVFQNCIVGGVIDNRFMPAIIKGIMEKMENGPMSGCRARDIRVSVYDGSMHSVDSNEAAFKTAGLMAFKDGFLKAGPKLLEPIYDVEITVPAQYMGDVMSDLSSRRGQIQGMDSEGSIQKVIARVPLEELDHYSTKLKSMTQGSGTYTRKFADYSPVPPDIQKRVVEETLQAESV
ncbi:MAG: elongation factor G [Balneolaceae bacterium]